MIEIKNLHAYYGSIEALSGINVVVREGKITCLIGNNGAGKSTTLNSISGMIKNSGSIKFKEHIELVGKSPFEITKLGISHVPEGRRIFPGLTVEENLVTGTISWHGFFGKESYSNELEEVYTLFPRLKERRNQLGWSLSGGEQQMLAIGRGLMARPKVLMMDEPSMGLAPLIVAELFDKIAEINKVGKTILLVEQNAKQALKVSHYGYVIIRGKIDIEGEAEVLKHDPRVTSAYLGRFTE